MTGNINSIVSNDRRFVRMAIMPPPPRLTENDIELLAKLADCFADVTELTNHERGVYEFSRAATWCLGEDNWDRVLQTASKFRAIDQDQEQEESTGSTDTVIAEPGISTMSLQRRVDRLYRDGKATASEAAQQAQKLSAGKAEDVKAFITGREPLPYGTMTGGVSPKQADDAADAIIPRSRQRMSLGSDRAPRDEFDTAADFILGNG